MDPMSEKRTSGGVFKPIGNNVGLQKRLEPATTKYDRVTSVVDTGASTSAMRRSKEDVVSIKRRPGEHFQRTRPTTVAAYLIAQQQRQQEEAESGAAGGSGDGWNLLDFAATQRSHLATPSEAPSVGAVSATSTQAAPLMASAKKLLLVDVRDPEDYAKCHIAGAVSFPAARLSRAANVWTPEVFACLNKPGCVLVLYDLEEEILVGRNVGNIIFEKGADNAVVMAAGMREFAQRNAEFLVGECPVPIVPRAPLLPTAALLSAGVGVGGASCAASTTAQSAATTHKPKGLSSSLARGPAESVGRTWR
jgi:centrosomal protein CEP41